MCQERQVHFVSQLPLKIKVRNFKIKARKSQTSFLLLMDANLFARVCVPTQAKVKTKAGETVSFQRNTFGEVAS